MRLRSRVTGAAPRAPHGGLASHLHPPTMTTMALRGAWGVVPRKGCPRPCAPTDTTVTGGSCREARGSCLNGSWQTLGLGFLPLHVAESKGRSVCVISRLNYVLCNAGPVGGPDRNRDARRAPAREQIREREPRERRRSIDRTRYIALLFLAAFAPPEQVLHGFMMTDSLC